MARARPRFEELVRRVGPLPVTGLASAETPPKAALADRERELRRMVSEYDGEATRSQALLEALVIAEEEGVPASACAEIRHELATRVRKLHAA